MDEKQGPPQEQQIPSGYGVPPPYTESSYPPPAQAYPASQQPYTTSYPPQAIHPLAGQQLPKPPEDYYTMSLLLSLLWCLVFAPYLLVCTIPALLKAKESRRAADSGDFIRAKEKAKEALTLNVVSIVAGFALMMIFMVVLPVLAGIIIPIVFAVRTK